MTTPIEIIPIDEVEKGQLITAEKMNELIDRINELEETVNRLKHLAGGTQRVPSLFGSRLGDALLLLDDPTIGLQRGPVVDAAGNIITRFTSAERSRMVISQSPAADLFVPRGSRLSLVIAGGMSDDGGDGGTIPEIRITRLEGGGADNEFVVSGDVVVVGINFGTDAEALEVRINDTTIDADSIRTNSFGTQLTVEIPASFSADTSADDPLSAVLTVRNASLGTEPVTSPPFTILPEPAQLPDISAIQREDGTLTTINEDLEAVIVNSGERITIMGTNLQLPEHTTVVRIQNLGNLTPESESDATSLTLVITDVSTDVDTNLRVVLQPADDTGDLLSNEVPIFILSG